MQAIRFAPQVAALLVAVFAVVPPAVAQVAPPAQAAPPVQAAPPAPLDAAAFERGARSRLGALRAVQPGGDAALLESNNRMMDEAWKFFDANRARALPLLRTELAAESAKADRNNLVLLGVGFYLYTHGDRADRGPARNAFFAIDPDAPIVKLNLEQYFFFAHSIAGEHDARILPLIDRAFLDKKVPLVIPEYALNLDPGLVCMFLYGAYGPDSEAHLLPYLKDPARVRKALEVLIWIGSPADNAAVAEVMKANRDPEVFGRASAFLMQAGGPEGRNIMLQLDPTQLDPKTAEFYSKARSHIEAISAQWYRGLFERFGGAASIPDAELRKRLAALKSGRGRDENLSPRAIFASPLPRDELIAGLVAARFAMLSNIYDQALDDVRTTNMVINGLRFRDH